MVPTDLWARSYSEIQTILRDLGDPAPGKRRLLRGQDRAYTSAGGHLLLPALVRPNSTHTYNPAWLGSVAMYLGQQGPGDFIVTGYTRLVWAPAFLQHYGPGSSYLDVTADLDIALWFSLYKYHQQCYSVPAIDGLDRRVSCAWYTETAQPWPPDEGPVLYVLDAPVWNGEGMPSHGQAVDLIALGAGKVDTAIRLHKQSGSLLRADPDAPGGPNLAGELRAVIRLAGDFDRSTIPSWGRPAREIFPPRSADPFYQMLLEIPAQMFFDPRCLRHPLEIPCYLVNVAPALLQPPDPASTPEIADYASIGAPIRPPLCYEFLLRNAVPGSSGIVEAGGSRFLLKDATPFLLEGPLMTFLPSVETEDLGDWLPSALPLGIATQIGGRSTDSVYVELSVLEHYYPLRTKRDEPNVTFVRAIWLVRAGDRYICTVYLSHRGEIVSYQMEFDFSQATGVFDRVQHPHESDSFGPSFQNAVWMAQKSLYLVLTLLRDLSPGFKPPALFERLRLDDRVPRERTLGTLLEPQYGQATPVTNEPYLIPKAMNGAVYAREIGSPKDSGDLWRTAPGGFETLEDAFRRIRDPWFLMLSANELGAWYGQRKQTKEGLAAAAYGIQNARKLRESRLARSAEAKLESLSGLLLCVLRDTKEAGAAFDRAAALYKGEGEERNYMETKALREQLCGPAPNAG